MTHQGLVHRPGPVIKHMKVNVARKAWHACYVLYMLYMLYSHTRVYSNLPMNTHTSANTHFNTGQDVYIRMCLVGTRTNFVHSSAILKDLEHLARKRTILE